MLDALLGFTAGVMLAASALASKMGLADTGRSDQRDSLSCPQPGRDVRLLCRCSVDQDTNGNARRKVSLEPARQHSAILMQGRTSVTKSSLSLVLDGRFSAQYGNERLPFIV
jgi:hypothetical protein